MPEAWRGWLKANVRLFGVLPPELRLKLEQSARIIVAERKWVGCGGLAVSEEMQVTVAGQAALLLLGEEGYYFDRVPSILLYGSAYVRPHKAGDRHSVDEDATLLGESWQQGSIVLSWPAVLSGGQGDRDGQNLVLHEFSHHLDGLDGEMGGTPPLPTRSAERRWHTVFDREYDRLADDLAAGRETLLDPYGTTSKAEFFAVATECFFERAPAMRARHAELYTCFREFYKIEPASWTEAESPAAGQTATADDEPDDFVDSADDAPASPAELPPLETADQYFTRGVEHFDLGHFELAADDFNRCVRLAPDDQEALLMRARSFLQLGHLEAALADSDRASRLDPRDKEALAVRGMCYTALGNYEAALADFGRAGGIADDDIQVRFYRGVAQAECGHWQEAADDFTEVIEIDPFDSEAFLERAQCFEELGKSAAAERDRQRAKELGQDGETERQREGEGG
jgi:Mlc titration factor MtfA (ptsG expression regulator)/Flp pilus assembly protein TadD